jgi:hypothetical protein
VAHREHDEVTTEAIDPRTGMPFGDHGSLEEALEWALDVEEDSLGSVTFLRAWREGSAFEEWQDFYLWLRLRRAGK